MGSEVHGAHLTFVASEDFRQTAMVVPSLPPSSNGTSEPEPTAPSEKEALRRAALEARKAFVRSLSDGAKAKLEQKLAERLARRLESLAQSLENEAPSS